MLTTTTRTLLYAMKEDSMDSNMPHYPTTDFIQILSAQKSDDVLNVFTHHPEIDLVFIDLDMDGNNTSDTIRKLKSLRRKIPVILLSSYVTFFSMRLAYDLGCEEILQTPLNESIFKNIIHKYL